MVNKFKKAAAAQARLRDKRLFEKHRARAQQIAMDYRSAGRPKQVEDMPQSLVQSRRSVAPRDRPINVFKRQVYGLACAIDSDGLRSELEATAREQAATLKIFYRPRNWTVIDWTVRYAALFLITVRTKKPGSNIKNVGSQNHLIDSSMITRISSELNFVFRHLIDPIFASTFIDDVGGYQIISKLPDTDVLMMKQDCWWEALRRDEDGGVESAVFFKEIKQSIIDDVDQATKHDSWK